jgi:hypothetical protein
MAKKVVSIKYNEGPFTYRADAVKVQRQYKLRGHKAVIVKLAKGYRVAVTKYK